MGWSRHWDHKSSSAWLRLPLKNIMRIARCIALQNWMDRVNEGKLCVNFISTNLSFIQIWSILVQIQPYLAASRSKRSLSTTWIVETMLHSYSSKIFEQQRNCPFQAIAIFPICFCTVREIPFTSPANSYTVYSFTCSQSRGWRHADEHECVQQLSSAVNSAILTRHYRQMGNIARRWQPNPILD